MLIKVHAASINPIDKMLMAGELKLVKPVGASPHVTCYDASGTVEVADKAGRFAVGDAVLTRLFGPAPGVESKTPWFRGSMAEFCVARAENCVKKPSNVSFEEAASVPLAGMTAYQALKGVQAGQSVFISGGAGGVGSLAIQLAKHVFKAGRVVTTASAGAKTELCKSLGADEVVDYTSEKFEEKLQRDFDLCFDCTAESTKMIKIVKKGGKIRSISGSPTLEAIRGAGGDSCILGLVLKKSAARAEFIETAAVGATWDYFFLSPSGDDLQALADALQAGHVKPVVDGVWDFASDDDEKGWRGAFSKQFSGRAKGKCVVKMI